MDFIVKLPRCQGYDSIWVVMDRLTRATHFVPIKESMDSSELARSFLTNIFKCHGFPKSIVSNWGPAFISSFFSLLMKLLGSKLTHSTTYHQKTDGLVEQTNQTLESYLWAFCSYQQDNWVSYLPLAKFTYNNCINSSTNTTPFFTNMGFHPSFDVSIISDTNNPAAQELSVCLQHIHKELCAKLNHSNEKMAIYYDCKWSSLPEYSPEDLVLLLCRNIKTTRPSNKLDYCYLGPFEILEKHGWSAYLLKLPSSLSHLHPVFNVDLLEPYNFPSSINGCLTPPTPHVHIQHDHTPLVIEKVLDILNTLSNGKTSTLLRIPGYCSQTFHVLLMNC